jgi:hypothetical protein
MYFRNRINKISATAIIAYLRNATTIFNPIILEYRIITVAYIKLTQNPGY